nr:prealbumin-like fold domain-containing protein [Allobaculum mucilyticum]
MLTGNDGKNFRLYPPVVVEVKSAPGENADLIQIFPKVEYPDIAVLKTDADDKAITGLPFEFRIYADEECKDELAVLTGEKKTGQTNFYTLSSKGTVYLKETKAPQGYKLSDEGIPVCFDGNTVSINEDQIVEAENNSGRYIISVKNEKDKGPIEDEDTSSSETSDSSSSSSDTTEDDASSQKPGQSNGKTNTAAGANLFGIMTVFAAAALCMTMLLVLMTQKRKQNK